MRSSAECRAIGAELVRLSTGEKDEVRRYAYENMAACWRALAEQYDELRPDEAPCEARRPSEIVAPQTGP